MWHVIVYILCGMCTVYCVLCVMCTGMVTGPLLYLTEQPHHWRWSTLTPHHHFLLLQSCPLCKAGKSGVETVEILCLAFTSIIKLIGGIEEMFRKLHLMILG